MRRKITIDEFGVCWDCSVSAAMSSSPVSSGRARARYGRGGW